MKCRRGRQNLTPISTSGRGRQFCVFSLRTSPPNPLSNLLSTAWRGGVNTNLNVIPKVSSHEPQVAEGSQIKTCRQTKKGARRAPLRSGLLGVEFSRISGFFFTFGFVFAAVLVEVFGQEVAADDKHKGDDLQANALPCGEQAEPLPQPDRNV